jgi:hypothetical protein
MYIASVATMRQVIQSLREDQVKIDAKWKTLLQERTIAIRQAVEAPGALLTTVLHVYHEWNELPQAVWNRVDQALPYQNNSNSSNNNSNTIAQGLDQMQFLQRILESQKSSHKNGTYYLDEVWEAIPTIYQPVAQYRNVVVCLWYWYCCQQRDNHWNNGSYATVRAMTRDMLMQRSSSSGAQANGANGALLLLGGAGSSSGILGGLPDDDDDDKDDDNGTTWTTTTTSSSATMAGGNHQHHLSYHDVQKSIYWKIFLNIGLERLEQDFLKSVQKRLIAPVHLMFPVLVLDESAAVGLPSKYDLQRFDEAIRNEIKLGIDDPSMIPIVAESIVLAVSEFCQRAAGQLVHGNYLAGPDFSMTPSLQQDRKIVAILYALYTYLSKAPKTVFGTQSSAATAADCTMALRPALATIDATIHAEVIGPVVEQVQQQLHTILAKPYGPEFVQTHVATALERITENVFQKFPPAYASSMANEIAEHTVLTFVTTVSLIRPMSENLRLQITQDLADLELAVQQLVASSSSLSSGNTTTTEAWIHSKGYAELRAVRQMLYWTGLEQSSAKTAPEIAKLILREVWLSDVRPSTIFHYLFSFAPSALSAPYHVANLSASAYIEQIVANEETTWIMVCCDRYGQRGAAAAASSSDGDPRVPQIVLTLGQELLRRRGRNE